MSLSFEDQRQLWTEREARAESMIPLIGRLYREHGAVTSIHGRRLINRSAIGILKAHKLSRQVTTSELDTDDNVRSHTAFAAAAVQAGVGQRQQCGVQRASELSRALVGICRLGS